MEIKKNKFYSYLEIIKKVKYDSIVIGDIHGRTADWLVSTNFSNTLCATDTSLLIKRVDLVASFYINDTSRIYTFTRELPLIKNLKDYQKAIKRIQEFAKTEFGEFFKDNDIETLYANFIINKLGYISNLHVHDNKTVNSDYSRLIDRTNSEFEKLQFKPAKVLGKNVNFSASIDIQII